MRKLNVLDIFSGTGSVSNVFKEHGHNVVTIDINPRFNTTVCDDIMNISAGDIIELFNGEHIDYIHMSPDCATYSIAAIRYHRKNTIDPISEKARVADNVRSHILHLLRELKPTYFTIENPRGVMRKMPDMVQLANEYNMDTVTYCQYGDDRMKPTDIWHNLSSHKFRPMCKNGAPCHQAAKRGSKSGTQGGNGSITRSIIPYELCVEIRDYIEYKGDYVKCIKRNCLLI